MQRSFLLLLCFSALTACGAKVVFDGEGDGGAGGAGGAGVGPGPGVTTSTTTNTSTTTTDTTNVTTVTTGPGGAPPNSPICVINENGTPPGCQACIDGPGIMSCGPLNDQCTNDPSCIDYATCVIDCNDQQPCCNDCEAMNPDGAKLYAALVDCFVCQVCPQCTDLFPNFCFLEG